MVKTINIANEINKNYSYIIISILILIYSIIIQYRYMAYFFPSKKITYLPSEFNMKYKEINIEKLNGWFFNHIQLASDKTNNKTNNLLIYFHGNAGNISNRIWIIKQLLNIFPNTDIYIYDYPQFGSSSGQLNISNIISSAYTVYSYWSSINANQYTNITLFGESIGAGIIAELYKVLIKFNYHNMPKMIVHLNGLTSLYKVIDTIIPSISKPFILPWITEFDCEKIYLKNITKLPKLLILHTETDEIININLVYELINKLSYSNNLHFIKIEGSHCQPIIDEICIKKIKYVYGMNPL